MVREYGTYDKLSAQNKSHITLEGHRGIFKPKKKHLEEGSHVCAPNKQKLTECPLS